MGLYVEYDAAGCKGVASPGASPLDNLERLFRGAGGGAVAGGAMILASLWFVGFSPVYAVGGMTLCIGLGMANALASAPRERVRFVVERGVLRITDGEGEERIAELAGARILRLPDGLVVNPRLGSAVTIHWGRAKQQVADTLVEMLEAATAHDLQAHGTSHNVPEQIRKMTES